MADETKQRPWGKVPGRICDEPISSRASKTDHRVLEFFSVHLMNHETGIWKGGTIKDLAGRMSAHLGHNEKRARSWRDQVEKSWRQWTRWGITGKTQRGLILYEVNRGQIRPLAGDSIVPSQGTASSPRRFTTGDIHKGKQGTDSSPSRTASEFSSEFLSEKERNKKERPGPPAPKTGSGSATDPYHIQDSQKGEVIENRKPAIAGIVAGICRGPVAKKRRDLTEDEAAILADLAKKEGRRTALAFCRKSNRTPPAWLIEEEA